MVINILENNQTKQVNVKNPISGKELLLKHFPIHEAATVVAFILDGNIKDLSWPVHENATVEFVKTTDNAAWNVVNYTGGLVVAYAIKKLFPKTQIALVKTSEDGFYVDFEQSQNLKGTDLALITNEVQKFINKPISLARVCQTLAETLKKFPNNQYAREYAELNQIDGLKCSYLIDNQELVIASGVAYSDSTILNCFELLAVTGAYWLGDDKNQQLQRITGVFAENKSELQQKLLEMENRKLRDHRVVGKKLNIFTFTEDTGKGLPIFLPHGMIIKKQLQEFLRKKEFKWGYQEVSTPVLGSVSLYQKSGHWDHYRENMFAPIVREQEQLVLRPMTCPHHCMIYKSQIHSYRELPIRYSENALLYRYEASGALTGLERVRSMELTDAHLFVRPDQIKEEFKRCFYLIDEVLKELKIEIDYFSLSLRDPLDKEKYYNDDAMWNQAEYELKTVLDELGINYQVMIGEAAFYGPKFDVQIKTPIGHEVTISTIQFDFLLPQKFELTYVDQQNQSQRPIIIHRGLIGTYERFIATLLEQTQGIFPLWLAPIQVVILPINNSEKLLNYCQSLADALINENIRTQISSNEGLNKRIKSAHEQKTPYVIIIGEKEVNNQTITYHTYQAQKTDISINQSGLIALLTSQIKNHH